MKRKKSEKNETKDPKPKKYKRKIENPEKQKARYVYDNKGESGKIWEKNRRDRLNKTFDELALLLPQQDPPVKLSKIDILCESIKYFETMTSKVSEVESELKVLKEQNSNIPVVVQIKDTKDASCMTDCMTDCVEENKENQTTQLDKQIQVSFKKKRKKVLSTQTKPLSKNLDEESKLCSDSTEGAIEKPKTEEPILSETSSATIVVTSSCSITANSTTFSSNTTSLTNTIVPYSLSTTSSSDTSTNNVPYISNSVRVTPALISTPIMTPSLFISNYPFVVSQVPQSVYIVNNKTEVTNTINNLCTVKSKTPNGRVPLPPLKKTVAVRKPPRKKRMFKKKDIVDSNDTKIIEVNEKDMQNESFNNEVKKDVEMESFSDKSKVTEIFSQEKIENNSPFLPFPNSDKGICKEIPSTTIILPSTANTTVVTSSDTTLRTTSSTDTAITDSPIISKPIIELPSATLLDIDSLHRTPQSHDSSSVNDTSTISNLDLDHFSILTANILSSIDTTESSDTNVSLQLPQPFKKNQTELINDPIKIKKGGDERSLIKQENIQAMEHIESIPLRQISMPQTGTNHIRKEFPKEFSTNIRASMPSSIEAPVKTTFGQIINSNNSSNSFTFSLSNTTHSTSQNKLCRMQKTTSNIEPKFETPPIYTMSGTSYSNTFSYGPYHGSSTKLSTSDTKSQQQYPYSIQNNAMPISTVGTFNQNSSLPYYSKTYDSQKPFTVDQPSTNFTFSLTAVSKSAMKYTTPSISKVSTHSTNTYPLHQDSCKKPSNNKSYNYNYNNDNLPPRTVSSHSIARLNSKFDHHKENATPFYLNQDDNCSKSNVCKPNGSQPLVTNNIPTQYAKFPVPNQSQIKQQVSSKVNKAGPSTSHYPQFSSRYDVNWMSSSEIKSNNTDFQIFPTMEHPQSSAINQSSYYSSSNLPNFDINRKTSDLYFAHPQGEENLPWSPSRMSSILDTPHISANQCFPTTLPNLHGDLALNTLSSNSSRSSNFLETPTKVLPINYNSSYNSKEIKRSNTTDSQTSNFSVRQLVDNNTSTKSIVTEKNTIRRKSGRKDGEMEFSHEILQFDNQKLNNYSAESLINSRTSKSKTWSSESHSMSHESSNNISNTLFSNVDGLNDQYNYTSNRYDSKLFNQNYVSSFVDNSFSNTTQNFHNFTKNQPFSFGDHVNSTIDYHQSTLGNPMNSFLSQHDIGTEKSCTQHLYPENIKSTNQSNNHHSSSNLHSSRTNPSISSSTSHSSKKLKTSHHSSASHHSLLMNYDFPVPPVTPSLTYFPPHEWKTPTSDSYTPISHNVPCTNTYINNVNLYSQPTQNSLTPLSSNTIQNSSNSLTNFNLSSICPEINDKVRQQNW